jgi:C4-dicarboxylate-specific signal transduction histidine kinase
VRVFHSFDTTDWGRVSLVVAAITAFWVGLAAILPERYHKTGMVILGSAQSALTLMMRSGKSRAEKIEEKIEEHVADGLKKREEIKELISKEAQEQAQKKEEKQ